MSQAHRSRETLFLCIRALMHKKSVSRGVDALRGRTIGRSASWRRFRRATERSIENAGSVPCRTGGPYGTAAAGGAGVPRELT
jgi:hypothetical protein